MSKKLLIASLTLGTLLIASNAVAAKGHLGSKAVPQPSSCIKAAFSQTGNQWWSNVSLQLTNNCGQSVNFLNTTITFNSSSSINTSFWGNFNPLSYPTNNLQITPQPISAGNFLESLSIQLPTDPWSNTMLPNGQSITIQYGVPFDVNKPTYDPTSVKVYVDGAQPIQTGEVDLTNITAQPSGISQAFAVVDVVNNGQTILQAQVPWAGMLAVPNLAPGAYTLQPKNITDSQGNPYQGAAVPATVNVVANQKVASTVSYNQVLQLGKINIQVGPLPAALSGYTLNPSVNLTRADTGSSVTQTIAWNSTTTVNQLANNVSYSFSTPIISFNNNTCTGSFVPVTLTSNATTAPTTQLSYSCIPIKMDKITLNVSGLPSSASSVTVTLTPSDGSAAVTKNVAIASGQGSDTVNLTDGVVYNVSASPVSGYTALFNPQPITASAAATESITYQQQSGGRIISYIPGWKTPPAATELANAGYTHMMIAFGVFSTTQPGQIVSAFDTVTKAYIDSLHNVGIKAILSLGGASTSIANTSVDFHQVLTLASSPTAFQQTMVQSIESFMTQYGFDGIDIDIEHGLNGGGTFSAPTGDIAVLANILKQLHTDNPNILLTLTPQTANVAATSGFDATWGNYASLIMQTYNVLSWVQIQIYNTGCTYGIDQVCYADSATTPNYSVATATDLLANWPAVDPSGRATGFQPYISHLTPNQVVLGYPAPNASGASDGAPVKPVPIIKRAIQCLRTATKGSNSCDTYVPPTSYPGFGGVFNWEITYDQNNNYGFAKGLSACVLQGNCN